MEDAEQPLGGLLLLQYLEYLGDAVLVVVGESQGSIQVGHMSARQGAVVHLVDEVEDDAAQLHIGCRGILLLRVFLQAEGFHQRLVGGEGLGVLLSAQGEPLDADD